MSFISPPMSPPLFSHPLEDSPSYFTEEMNTHTHTQALDKISNSFLETLAYFQYLILSWICSNLNNSFSNFWFLKWFVLLVLIRQTVALRKSQDFSFSLLSFFFSSVSFLYSSEFFSIYSNHCFSYTFRANSLGDRHSVFFFFRKNEDTLFNIW